MADKINFQLKQLIAKNLRKELDRIIKLGLNGYQTIRDLALLLKFLKSINEFSDIKFKLEEN